MSIASFSASDERAHAEAREVLTAAARGHTGRIPGVRVADLVLRVTPGGDFPVRTAALEAVLRRVQAAHRSSGWQVQGKRRVGVGRFLLQVAPGRSYPVVVRSFEALAGSCGCADFRKNGLSVCKHLWWLIEQGFDKKGIPLAGQLPEPELAWDPVRPLLGPGDWLERVRFTGAELPAVLRPWFRRGTGHLLSAHADAPLRRHALVRALSTHGKLDPALEGLLRREADALERRAELEGSRKRLGGALRSLDRKLFPYQEQGVRRFLETGRLLLADDMGLGKTAQAIAACHVLHATGRVKKGFIIVPAALKTQWLREWKQVTRAPAELLDGTPSERARQLRATRSGFLIVNYEQVLKDLPALLRFEPELVVLDEAQRIKNWAAKTSAFVKRLQPAYRLVLTGTPLENRLSELASLLEWVDELALEPTWRLAEWHATRADGGTEVVGARNLETLRARIAPCTLRRTRCEVLSQLPSRTDTRVPVPLTPEQQVAHAEFDQPIAQLVQTSKRRPLTQAEFLRLMSLMTRQRVICNGLAQRDFDQLWPGLQRTAPSEAVLRGLFTPKLAELRELLSNLVVTQGLKVVVFSQWKRMLHLAKWAVADILEQNGLRGVSFTGDETSKRRTQNVVDFHDDPRTRLFFATDAGGVGLNLQRAASACVHLDLPWNPAVLEQRSGRIHRHGQEKPVEIYALVAASGIESRIASIVGDKKVLFDGLFDGSSDAVRFEQGGSFLSTMQKLVEPVEVPGPADAPLEVDSEDEPVETEPEDSAEGARGDDAVDAAPPAPLAASASATSLLPGLTVKSGADGRLVLEAEPAAAAQLAGLLEGLAALLRSAPRPL